jgi:hypothetical protein
MRGLARVAERSGTVCYACRWVFVYAEHPARIERPGHDRAVPDFPSRRTLRKRLAGQGGLLVAQRPLPGSQRAYRTRSQRGVLGCLANICNEEIAKAMDHLTFDLRAAVPEWYAGSNSVTYSVI